MNFNTPTKPLNHNTPTSEQLRKAINTRHCQRRAILNHLIVHGSLSTLQAYQARVMAPAARIFELKEAGHIIHTSRDWCLNGLGTYHLIKLAAPKAKVVIND